MKRKIVIILAVVVIVIAGGLFLLRRWMEQPLYKPGDVRAGRNLRGSLQPPAQPGDSGIWQVEPDVRLRWFARGEGKNVLFVHGGPGFPVREPYAGLEALGGRFRIHYYDQRGCGGSSRPIQRFESRNFGANLTQLDQALGIGAQLADIERIRRILGDGRLILIGHSYGGFLAALYAAEFPERVRAMVLIAPANLLVMPSPAGGLFDEVRRRLPAQRQAAYDAWLKRYLDFSGVFSKSESELAAEHLEFAAFYRDAGGVPPSLAAARSEDAGGWMVRAQYFSMGRRHDYRPAMAGVRAPVLVIHGDRDFQPEAASREYVTALPNATLKVIPGAGHFPQQETPDRFAGVVMEFLLAKTS